MNYPWYYYEIISHQKFFINFTISGVDPQSIHDGEEEISAAGVRRQLIDASQLELTIDAVQGWRSLQNYCNLIEILFYVKNSTSETK